MQNSGFDTLPSPIHHFPLRLKYLHDIRSPNSQPKEWPRIVFFAVQTRQSFTGSIMRKENGERRRIATCLADTCTLTDTTEYINLRNKFLSKIKEISENEIGKVVVRTRKHPNELVDSKVLDLINRVVGE
ncbi:hypothetical protein CWI36_2572p0020, partial [Hamiltosporidium magnivora]